MKEYPPYIEGLISYIREKRAPFHIPGHKQGRSIPYDTKKLFQDNLFNFDVTSSFDRDDLYNPQYFLKQSLHQVQALYKTTKSYYVVHGSTGANQYALLTVLNPHSEIIIPRNCHKLVWGALVASQACPVYVMPEYNIEYRLYIPVLPDIFKAAMQNHPNCKTLYTIYPSYYGICADLAEVITYAHRSDRIVINDEAHGAHLFFNDHLPPSTVQMGADITVQSLHKNLSGLTQTSLLHVQGNSIDINKLEQVMYMYQTSSPSPLLLASMDYAVHQMAGQGQDLLKHTLELAAFARESINQIPPLCCLGHEHINLPGFADYDLDFTKLLVSVKGLEVTGFEAKEYLGKQLGIEAELADIDTILFVITIGDTVSSIRKLIQGLKRFVKECPKDLQYFSPMSTALPKLPKMVLTPAETFYCQSEVIPLEKAVNRISKEFIIPYPPGIPVLVPGEVIDTEIFYYLKDLKGMHATFTGSCDSRLDHITVVK